MSHTQTMIHAQINERLGALDEDEGNWPTGEQIEAVIGAVLDDLKERLHRADDALQGLAPTRSTDERLRVLGKAEGVRLALSYIREYGS